MKGEYGVRKIRIGREGKKKRRGGEKAVGRVKSRL
jgi:hypothetical protein